MTLIQEYYNQWSKIAEATKVLLEVPESNLDREDPESLVYRGESDENETDNP